MNPTLALSQARPRGWTLTELLIVLALGALLLSMALPSFSSFLEHRRIEGLSAQLISDLQYLRSSAVARQTRLRLRIQSHAGGSSCYLLHSGASDACGCDRSGQVQCQPDAELLRQHVLPPDSALQLSATSASLLVDPRLGTFTPAGSIDVHNRSGAQLRHVINVLGRVRLCSPSGSWTGAPAC
ncbi:MAG: hypothetical protein RJA44_1476 [Pseudomonadota bacterium]